MTTLVMLTIMLFGIAAYRLLPVSDLPNVDFPSLVVTAELPGATPETMASAVATPLEKQFSTIAGIDSMTSQSQYGRTSITLVFNLEKDIDAAALDVQAAISVAQGGLPKDMPNPPAFTKVNPADQPILYVALTSPSLPLYNLNEYGETMIAQRLSMVSGVAQVLIYGSQKYAVRVQLDPNTLANKKIGLDEVAQAIREANVNLPTGTLYGKYTAWTIQANGQLRNAEAYKPIIVAYRNGSPVRLIDVANIIDSTESDKNAASYLTKTDESRSIVLAIQRQPGTNTVAVSKASRDLLFELEKQLPASVSFNLLYDRAQSIKASIEEVQFTLLLTLCLVVMVIFIFLRNLSATIIPSLALPLSIIGTFAFMHVFGYSLDNLSLMALTLSVGFVVDDAIVMLENIVRHLEMGKKPFEAAIYGAREVGFTIISMTLSLAAVFLPVLFLGGIIGRLFHEFAVTIGIAILISGFVSLTLTPMLGSRFLRAHKTKQKKTFGDSLYNFTEKGFDLLLKFYAWGLRISLNHKLAVMFFSLIILVGTIMLFQRIPKGFIPSEDNNRIFGFTQAIEGVGFENLIKRQMEVSRIIQKDPDMVGMISNAGQRKGGRAASSSNSGIVFITFKPKAERKSSISQIIERLRPQLAQVPGIRVFLQNPPPIQIGGRIGKGLYQLTLQGNDTDELYKSAQKLEEKIKTLPGIQDISSDLEIKSPQVNIEIDRDKASSLGISAEKIEDTLYYAFGARQISTIYAPGNTYQVILELAPEFQLEPTAVSKLYVSSKSGNLVPLDTIANISVGLGPLSVNHTGQQISVTLSYNLKPDYPLGNAIADIKKLSMETLPDTVTTTFQGTAQEFQTASKNLGMLLIFSILVIYIVLGILYESFIHPITILSALPFAGFGALVTLIYFKIELNVYAFIGIIMLVGLVKKNGIMMVDFAIDARKHGKTSVDAIYEACLIRFRPIMMTTMAALMGTIPLAFGTGAGSEARQPLGLAVVGGLIFSQFLTLYVTPVFYVYMEMLQVKLSGWFGRK
jgi:HAE1 family hydrophobic/amphiphilic exporter-1